MRTILAVTLTLWAGAALAQWTDNGLGHETIQQRQDHLDQSFNREDRAYPHQNDSNPYHGGMRGPSHGQPGGGWR